MTIQTIEVEPAGTAGSDGSLSFPIRTGTPHAPLYQAIDWTPNQRGVTLAAADVQSPRVFQKTFDRLATQWRHETGMSSSISKKVRHPAYQAIMAMDLPVVRLILRDMQQRPGHWFVALKVITGEDPVPNDSMTFQQATDAWIAWGIRQGLIVG